MTERWQREVRKLGSVEPEGDAWKRAATRAPGGDGLPPPRQRMVAGIVAFGVFFAAASFGWLALRPTAERTPGEATEGTEALVTLRVGTEGSDTYPVATLNVDGAIRQAWPSGYWWDGESRPFEWSNPPHWGPDAFVGIKVPAVLSLAGDADWADARLHSPDSFLEGEGQELGRLETPQPIDVAPGRYVMEIRGHWRDHGNPSFYFPIEVLPPSNGEVAHDGIVEFRLVHGIGAILRHGGSELVGITSEPYTVGDPYDGRAFHDVIPADFPYVIQIPKHTEFRVARDERLDGYTWWPQRPADSDLGQVMPGRLGPEIFYLRVGLRDGTEFDVAFAIEVVPSSSSPDLVWNDVLDCTDVKTFESGSNVIFDVGPIRWFNVNVPGMRASDVPRPVGGRTGADETRETGWVVLRGERIAWVDYRSLAGVACVGSGIGGA